MAETTKKKILIVDDQDSLRSVMKQYLSDVGYVVETVENGEQCIEIVPSFRPDLIVLDIMMPGIHGFDVLKHLKTDPATASIGIIICSAKDYKPEKDLALQQGAFGYMTKPFALTELIEIVQRFFNDEPMTPKQSVASTKKSDERFNIPSGPKKSYLHFWGTRGSIPVSGSAFVRHGGNTPCLEINNGSSTVIIDAGTGIRELGLQLMKEPPQQLNLFIGHTHWDHIQGFPFFTPAYRGGTSLTVYGASGFGKDLKSVFSGQLDADYFPVQLEDFPSSIEFRQLSENPVLIGSLKIFWEYVHHPGAAVGFKFQLNRKTIVYITDNEFLKGYLGAPNLAGIPGPDLERYGSLIQFISNADVLISEAQYTNEEYPQKVGWGHTSLSNACLLCKLGNVRRWIVTHHDPMHSDEFLNEKLLVTRHILDSIEYSIPVSHAYDGLTEFF